MAITLASSPDFYKPAYNIIEWKFASTNYTQCDFQYLCDLYINGSFATTLVAFPDENGLGIFQIQRALQDYMTLDLHIGLVGFTTNDNSICSYQLQIKEQYNSTADCTGASTVSGVLYTSSTHYAWNGHLQYKEYLQSPLIYVCTGATSKFLTNFPNRMRVATDEEFVLSFLQDAGTSPAYDQVDKAMIRTYDRNRTLLRTETITNPFSGAATQYQLSLSLGAGPKNINQSTLDGSPPAYQPLIGTGVKYYSICLLDSSQNIISEVKEFEVDERCTSFRNYRLWFRNRKGMFDAFTFNLKAIKKISVTRDTFDAPLDTVYSEGDRGITVADIRAEEAIVFTSNWVTQEEGSWLAELFTTDEAFAVDNTIDTYEYLITGFMYNGGFTDFVLPSGVELPVGTEFTYEVDSGFPLISDTGSGTVTAYNSGSGTHSTDIPAAVNAGVNSNGVFRARIRNSSIIPLIITSTTYEEKTKPKKVINYTIETRPAYRLNV